jgi:hypothetical protein
MIAATDRQAVAGSLLLLQTSPWHARWSAGSPVPVLGRTAMGSAINDIACQWLPGVSALPVAKRVCAASASADEKIGCVAGIHFAARAGLAK